MTILENYRINGMDFAAFRRIFAPDAIAPYVAKHLPRMYTGTAPTLTQMKDAYGEKNVHEWLATMLKAVLDFTGLSEKFNPTQIPVTIGNIIAQYAGLKATELMHFVFLMQNGEYEEFFGNPNGAKLMKSLKRYFEEVCQPSRARYLKAMEREKSEIERTREKAANCGFSAEMLAQQIAEEFSEENQARMREWRLEPWATAMCRAFSSVDKPEWTAKPWEWTYDQRKAWAAQNADLVKAFPNLNVAS